MSAAMAAPSTDPAATTYLATNEAADTASYPSSNHATTHSCTHTKTHSCTGSSHASTRSWLTCPVSLSDATANTVQEVWDANEAIHYSATGTTNTSANAVQETDFFDLGAATFGTDTFSI